MANRYAEEIRRIVGVDNLAGGIGPQTPKQPIVGGRGIAYFNADGSIGSDSGTKGETIQPEDAVDGNATTDGDGNTGDDITHEPVGDEGIVPVTDLFDGTLGIGDSFTGVNGLEDCATGQEYEVRGDGQLKFPDGWADAHTPPVDETYQEGKWWAFPNSGVNRAPTIDLSIQLINEYNVEQGINEYYVYPYFGGPIKRYRTSDDVYLGQSAGTSGSCTGGHAEAWYCNPTPEQIAEYGAEFPEEWPAQLTWDVESSAFIASKYDGNVASEYKSNNAGQVTLCDSSGNQYTVVPSKDGGLVFTDVTNNIFIVRNSAGKITAAGTGSNRDQYVAK